MNYDNTNRGALFKADKQGNEKRPDYTGNLNVAGAELQISAWIKSSQDGKKYMSLSVQPKRVNDQPPPVTTGRVVVPPEDTSDIPF